MLWAVEKPANQCVKYWQGNLILNCIRRIFCLFIDVVF